MGLIDDYNWLESLTGSDDDDTIAAAFPLRSGVVEGYSFVIKGLAGNDRLTSDAGPANWPHYATGPNADAQLWVGVELYGGEGNDILISARPYANLTPQQQANLHWQESLDGGDGDDVYIMRGPVSIIQEGFSGGNDTIRLGEAYIRNTGSTSFTLQYGLQVEDIDVRSDQDFTLTGNDLSNRLTLGAGHDLIHAGGGDDTVLAGAGNDTIYGDDPLTDPFNGIGDLIIGGAGDDEIYGGIDNDTILGGAGGDVMEGGQGDDVIEIDTLDDSISESAGMGHDTVRSSTLNLNGADYANFEGLMLTGNAALTLTGAEGYDSLTGNAGANLITAVGSGPVTLSGGAGQDTLIGSDGDDMLQGGAGRDLLQGGAGDDRFYFAFADTAKNGFYPVDTIAFFEQGHDLIDLSGLVTYPVVTLSTAPHGALDMGVAETITLAFRPADITFDGSIHAGLRVLVEITGDGLADASFLVFAATPLTLTLDDFVHM